MNCLHLLCFVLMVLDIILLKLRIDSISPVEYTYPILITIFIFHPKCFYCSKQSEVKAGMFERFLISLLYMSIAIVYLMVSSRFKGVN